MTAESTADQLRSLLTDVEALRDSLQERRRSTQYPWDPAPIEDYQRLHARARGLLPPGARLPEPAASPTQAGQRLWRTPTDETLDGLESLRAAIATALEAAT